MRHILYLLLLNVFIVHLSAQSSDLRFISLSTEDGLSNNTVVCILQDTQGFMWFGTEDGLNRFDGYDFSVFRHNPDESNSLTDNNISSLFQDDSGYIWIGTKGGGLNRYDPRTEVFSYYLHDPADSSSLCSNDILSIYQDRAGQTPTISQRGPLAPMKFYPLEKTTMETCFLGPGREALMFIQLRRVFLNLFL